MILDKILIENYKQFAGAHVFRPDESGVIAIIGDNGAGKTTLFEAIEWCLFSPSRIKRSDVRPHHFPGDPRVSVVLADPATGERTVVTRSMNRSGATKVSIYPEAEPERLVATGADEVARYVQQRLIGLPHKAFEATIFTRQNELGFFSDLSAGQRRVQVAKLLGLEVIRAAQESLSGKHTEQSRIAKLRHNDFLNQSDGRDFSIELETHQETILVRQAEADRARDLLNRLQKQTSEQATLRDSLQQLQLEDQRLSSALQGIAARQDLQQARANSARTSLDQINEQLKVLPQLRLLADRLPEFDSQISVHAIGAEQLKRRQDAAAKRDASQNRLSSVQRELQASVEQHPNSGIEGWHWQPLSASQLPETIARLVLIARGVDVASIENTLKGMTRVKSLQKAVDDQSGIVHKYENRLNELQTQLREQLAAGDPDAAAKKARADIATLAEQVSMAESRRRQLGVERESLQRILDNLSKGIPGEQCPTCGRPFTESDQTEVTALLSEKVAVLQNQHDEVDRDRQNAVVRKQAAEEEERLQQKRQQEVVATGGNLQTGQRSTEDAVAALQDRRNELTEALAASGLDGVPADATIEATKTRFETLLQIAMAAEPLERLGRRAQIELDEIAGTEEILAAIGDVSYDADVHRKVEQLRTKALTATGQIDTLSNLAMQRPAHEATIEEAAVLLVNLENERQQVATARKHLAFDPLELANAAFTLSELHAQANEASSEATRQEGYARSTEEARDRFLTERDRILQLEQESNRLAREAESFLELAKAMSRFDQYVAQRITPQLAEETAELLSQVTDGKYTEVRFDDNYGIEVMDEAGEFFPLATYSGGERDVIALCARLALSQFIGSQSVAQPRFVVLDEVFGSLDRVRRDNLIELLSSLVGGASAFEQIFMISHVSEVKQATLDQVWQVTEAANGSSQLEEFTPGSQAVDG